MLLVAMQVNEWYWWNATATLYTKKTHVKSSERSNHSYVYVFFLILYRQCTRRGRSTTMHRLSRSHFSICSVCSNTLLCARSKMFKGDENIFRITYSIPCDQFCLLIVIFNRRLHFLFCLSLTLHYINWLCQQVATCFSHGSFADMVIMVISIMIF